MPMARMRRACQLGTAILGSVLAGWSAAAAAEGRGTPFDHFELPDDWEARFWAEPGVQALLAKTPKELAALVPVQAGLRFCRCPSCDAGEPDDPLAWSPERPEVLTCRCCGARF